MNKIESEVSEENVVEVSEQQTFELSISELDMVGGGNWGTILA